MVKAVFLDRDGTLNFDPGYLSDHTQFELFDGAGQALRLLSDRDFHLFLVTNQSGIARGKITWPELTLIHQKLKELLGQHCVEIKEFLICPHLPEDKCACRKPSPKLILEAAHKYGLDMSQSIMIGDSLSDLLAGQNAGCGRVCLVRTGKGSKTEKNLSGVEPDFIGDSLVEVVNWICDH